MHFTGKRMLPYKPCKENQKRKFEQLSSKHKPPRMDPTKANTNLSSRPSLAEQTRGAFSRPQLCHCAKTNSVQCHHCCHGSHLQTTEMWGSQPAQEGDQQRVEWSQTTKAKHWETTKMCHHRPSQRRQYHHSPSSQLTREMSQWSWTRESIGRRYWTYLMTRCTGNWRRTHHKDREEGLWITQDGGKEWRDTREP